MAIGPFLFLYFYCSWFGEILGQSGQSASRRERIASHPSRNTGAKDGAPECGWQVGNEGGQPRLRMTLFGLFFSLLPTQAQLQGLNGPSEWSGEVVKR